MNDFSRDDIKEIIKDAITDAAQDRAAFVVQKSNGDGLPWDTIYKVAQLAIFPALAVIFYMLTQLGNLDRRVTIAELVQAGRPNFTALAEKEAVIEERQRVNTGRIDALEKAMEIHKSKSPYDKPK